MDGCIRMTDRFEWGYGDTRRLDFVEIITFLGTNFVIIFAKDTEDHVKETCKNKIKNVFFSPSPPR